jgi:acyl-CoA thioesterase-1
VEIIDAGVSGDTTSAGLARLDWSIPDGVDGVILELGANDALRGLPPETTRENLDAMIARLKQRGIAVLLAGMLAPPNMGAVTRPGSTPSTPISRKSMMLFSIRFSLMA